MSFNNQFTQSMNYAMSSSQFQKGCHGEQNYRYSSPRQPLNPYLALQPNAYPSSPSPQVKSPASSSSKQEQQRAIQSQLQQQLQQQLNIEYNNVNPRTRSERENQKDKDAIEKSRIDQRVGYVTRNTDMKQLLHNPDPKSALFISENERFDKDFSIFDKNQRQNEFIHKEIILEKHRIEALERESRRWENMEVKLQKEEIKKNLQSEKEKAFKRNGNGIPVNPITLEYYKNEFGNKLRIEDDKAKVRGFVRADNLDTRNNCGYNILNGENRMNVDVLVPNHLKPAFSNKLEERKKFYTVKYVGETNNNADNAISITAPPQQK